MKILQRFTHILNSSSESRLKRFLKFSLVLALAFLIFSIGSVIVYRFIPIAYTPLMLLRAPQSGIEKKWVPAEQIARSMQLAVIRAEDAKFFTHRGFDFDAIEKAMKYNKTHKKQKGASTISQQTAKNVFLWPARSWLRKGLEVYFTILIEQLWSKHRILEVYLNIIELGPGVYGVEAAAEKFFHKKAKHLSNAESALIASVLPNPLKFKINRPSAYILRRQRKIMGRSSLASTNHIKSEVNQDALVEVSKAISSEENKEFLDIKFDNDDEGDNGVDDKDSTPSTD